MWFVGSSSRSRSGLCATRTARSEPSLLTVAQRAHRSRQIPVVEQPEVAEGYRRPGQPLVHLMRRAFGMTEGDVLGEESHLSGVDRGHFPRSV